MIPYRDENPTCTFPIIVVGLIAANIVVFMCQMLLPGAGGNTGYGWDHCWQDYRLMCLYNAHFPACCRCQPPVKPASG